VKIRKQAFVCLDVHSAAEPEIRQCHRG